MNAGSLATGVILSAWLISVLTVAGEGSLTQVGVTDNPRTFPARGVIQELPPDFQTVVIKHEAISNFMAAMTMPFKVRDPKLLAGLHPGDEVSFRLTVTKEESWVDKIHKVGTAPVDHDRPPAGPQTAPSPVGSFMDYPLTNELGQKVTLHDFHGQALAITFFYTRCPLPDFCPRLAKNFQEATKQLRALPKAPANWHFLSISFDTGFDTPAMLKAYGDSYEYHPDEWSFLTGSPADIKELARISGVDYTPDSGAFKHNFRTLIVDAAGRLQMVFPMGGDISGDIVTQILKAATGTNQPNLTANPH